MTSIAVNDFATGQTMSFSIHVVAERLGIERGDIHNRYEEVERQLLQDFFSYCRDRRNETWVHWNMENIAYGFEHIEHRYSVLTKDDKPPSVPVENRVNLSSMIRDRYGKDYAPHPRMQKLMELNGEVDRNFLRGPDEIEAFRRHEFVRLHLSVLAKLHFFRAVIEKIQSGRLKTTSKSIVNLADKALDSRFARIASVIANLLAILGVVWTVGALLLSGAGGDNEKNQPASLQQTPPQSAPPPQGQN